MICKDITDRLVAYDVETTIEPITGPSAYDPRNSIVMEGLKSMAGGLTIDHIVKGIRTRMAASFNRLLDDESIICGHHLRFDIAHAYHSSPHMFEMIEGLDIWDTQVAHYLLTGQKDKWPTLNEAAKRYKYSGKLDQVSQYFAHGIGADHICPDLLRDYFEQDLWLTLSVAKDQIEEAHVRGMLPFMRSMMRAAKELALMEIRGMEADATVIVRHQMALNGQMGKLLTEMEKIVNQRCRVAGAAEDKLDLVEWDFDSRTMLLALYNGDPIIVSRREKVGTYKNGNDKFANVSYEVPTTALQPGKALKKLDAEVLQEFADNGCYFSQLLLELRGRHKLLRTYLNPIVEMLQWQRANDNAIHPQFNTCATDTGRLSSSKPNFQNMTSKGLVNVKEIYVARKGKSFIEFDYKQMEVVALAVLSKCPALTAAVLAGTDIHNATGNIVFGRSPTDEERRSIKAVNFGLIYGGQAKTLAAQSGFSVELTQKCIDAFYKLYPGVKKWKDEYKKRANSGGDGVLEVVNIDGTPPTEYVLVKSPSGRMLTYRKWASDWGEDKPSPTQLANYPVQSLATGDVSQTMLWVLAKVLRDKFGKRAYLVNTVHDSFLIEADDDILDEVYRVAKGVLERAHMVIPHVLGFNWNVPLKVDGKVGKSWGSLTKR